MAQKYFISIISELSKVTLILIFLSCFGFLQLEDKVVGKEMLKEMELDSAQIIYKEADIRLLEFKYRKGVEVIQLIFEKILALDHHFTSINTFQLINELSNPNSYPDFAKIKEKLKANTQKRSSINLPAILDNNSLVSLSYSVISSIIGSGNKKERQEEIDKISCILDFTVSMNGDLKIIYYETDFLRTSNLELKNKCEQLFKEYTKVVSYHKSLNTFRGGDDWDNLNKSIEGIIDGMRYTQKGGSIKDQIETRRKINNLEFSITRLLKFIDSYEDFINQGERYYKKFLTILDNYNNQELCVDNLPSNYTDLKSEVRSSISKFKSAYRIAELQGTKLRDLLYGVPI